jgi:hypothetical protein
MGILFSDAEFPDYVHFPVLTIEAARAGVLPLVVAALVLSMWEDQRAPTGPAHAWTVERSVRLDPPHIHVEGYEPSSPNGLVAVGGTNGGANDGDPMTWQSNSSMEAANVVIRNHRVQHERQTWIAMDAGRRSANFLATDHSRGCLEDVRPTGR